MKLYISERFLSFQDKTPVTDESGNEKYFVQGRFIMGKEYSILDPNGRELALVTEKKVSSTGKCVVRKDGAQVCEIVPKITLVKTKYEVKRLGWIVEGNFKQDNFVIKQNGAVIVSARVRLLTKGNAFEIDIAAGIDEVTALAVILVIEGILENTVIGTSVLSSVQGSMLS